VTEWLEIASIPLVGKLNLRIAPSSAAAWTDVLGVALPLVPNTVALTVDGWIAWLGPDEWLVVSPHALDSLEDDLRAAAGDVPVSIVDVSSARASLRISGRGARRLLAHGCALDLHPRVFPPGRCAQTRLAYANVLIAAPHDTDSYDVLVGASYARYLTDWLRDAVTAVTATI
jgi:sarcosine oxidase subunit gamma